MFVQEIKIKSPATMSYNNEFMVSLTDEIERVFEIDEGVSVNNAVFIFMLNFTPIDDLNVGQISA